MRNLLTSEGEDVKQYESKTSVVIQQEDELVYNIALESVLASHQDAVSSVEWGLIDNSQLCLLTCSFDFTVCVWKPDSSTGIWSVESTLGAM